MTRVRPSHRRRHVQPTQPHQTNKASGLQKRKIEHKTSFFNSTMGKAIAIALIALVIIAPMIGIGYYMIPNRSFQHEVVRAGYSAIRPHYVEPVVPHEYFVRGFVHPEHWIKESDERTTHACKVSEDLKELRT